MRIVFLIFVMFFVQPKGYSKILLLCEEVQFHGKFLRDVNVMFLTGYELNENIGDLKNPLYLKNDKFAIILISEATYIIKLDIDSKNTNNKPIIPLDIPGNPNSNIICGNEFNYSCLNGLDIVSGSTPDGVHKAIIYILK